MTQLEPEQFQFTNADRAMNTKVYIECGLLTIVVLAGSVATLSAAGFRLPDQDAFATARGEAFAATADNASAIYYNPAGISQLKEWNFRGGIYGLYLPLSYDSPSGHTSHKRKTLQGAFPQPAVTRRDRSPVLLAQ